MMPRQVYRCPKHGEFERDVLIKQAVPPSWPCAECNYPSPWVPSVPNFIGGPTTGAKKE
ncbi:hypothetical protein LCGC14_2829850 [marine sediment metagenome]|uniref:Uncharacterized protein n=1 Tax=marine sediment metagenome TaxID=412755 RepID=A0A0F8YEE4_9ZZZZ